MFDYEYDYIIRYLLFLMTIDAFRILLYLIKKKQSRISNNKKLSNDRPIIFNNN